MVDEMLKSTEISVEIVIFILLIGRTDYYYYANSHRKRCYSYNLRTLIVAG